MWTDWIIYGGPLTQTMHSSGAKCEKNIKNGSSGILSIFFIFGLLVFDMKINFTDQCEQIDIKARLVVQWIAWYMRLVYLIDLR